MSLTADWLNGCPTRRVVAPATARIALNHHAQRKERRVVASATARITLKYHAQNMCIGAHSNRRVVALATARTTLKHFAQRAGAKAPTLRCVRSTGIPL